MSYFINVCSVYHHALDMLRDASAPDLLKTTYLKWQWCIVRWWLSV